MTSYEGLNKKTHKVRLSQIITTYGPGAIIDFVDQPLMTATPREWAETNTIHDERLEKILGVDKFKIPKNSDAKRGVPFVRFPKWYFCPRCKVFQPLSKWEKEYKPGKNEGEFMKKPVCCEHDKRIPLVPSSVLVACRNGHIDDFPWIEWIHLKQGYICDNPSLKITSNSGSLGLEGFTVKCKCGASNTLAHAFAKDAFEKINNESYRKKFECKGKLQWKGDRQKCEIDSQPIYPQAVLRNASNIYFSKIESSIVIPPYSDEINSLIENSEKFNSLIDAKNMHEKMGMGEQFKSNFLEMYIIEVAKEIRKEKSIDVISKIINRKLYDNPYDENNSRNSYRLEEYNALMKKITSDCFNSKDFKIEKKDGNEYNMPHISSVTLVKRLREVRALVGFTRINPPNNYIIGSECSSSESKLVSVKEHGDDWYPAYEVRGEGIFIELNNDIIEAWIQDNPCLIERYSELEDRYNIDKDEDSKRSITPKFILLHTLAHVLIRELSFECGYSATSLRERIYCDLQGDTEIMSGILIYTADGDSEGSLGGLVKQGDPSILPKIFSNAIRKSKWCSYDPVCINSGGQGRKSQNLAACHSCLLLPETSCEEFNVLLDRVCLVGKLDNKEIGFFKDYI